MKGEANDPFSLHLLARTNTTGASYAEIAVVGKKRCVHDRNFLEHVLRNIFFDGNIFTHALEFTIIEFGTASALHFYAHGALFPLTAFPFCAKKTCMRMKREYSLQVISSYFFYRSGV